MNVQVISPIFKNEPLNFIIDPIYGIQYALEPLNSESMKAWANAELNPHMELPSVNEFIPHNFALKQAETLNPDESQAPKLPELISNKDNSIRVWHLLDNLYKIPKVFYGVFFQSAKLHDTPLNFNLISLYIKLYMDHVNQQYYSGRLVSSSYNLVANKFGLELSVYGFNDRLDSYVLSLVKELINYRIDPTRYEIHRDVLQNQLKIFSTSPIRDQLNCFIDILISSNSWSNDELNASYGEITIEATQAIVLDILTCSQVEMLIYGNVTKEESIAFANKLSLLLISVKKPGLSPMNPLMMFNLNRDIQLLNDTIYEYLVSNDEQENHGIVVYYQLGLENLSLRAQLELFHQIIYSPYFNQIRMTEQLAYVLALSLKYTYSGTIGLYALIQTGYPITYVESRLEAFFNSVNTILSNTTEEQFERAKNSLITRLNETPKRLQWMANRYWSEITSGQYRFDRNRELVEQVKLIKEPEIIVQLYKV